MSGHDPVWVRWSTEALEQYLDRLRVYRVADPSWKAGPEVIAMVNRELQRRKEAA